MSLTHAVIQGYQMIRKCDAQSFKIILTFSMMYGYHLVFKKMIHTSSFISWSQKITCLLNRISVNCYT